MSQFQQGCVCLRRPACAGCFINMIKTTKWDLGLLGVLPDDSAIGCNEAGLLPKSWSFIVLHQVYTSNSRWWFQIFFIFTPTWGNDLIWPNIFQMGWNHQLEFRCYSFVIFPWSICNPQSQANNLVAHELIAWYHLATEWRTRIQDTTVGWRAEIWMCRPLLTGTETTGRGHGHG